MRAPKNFPALVEMAQLKLSLSNADAISALKKNLNYYSTTGVINKKAIDAAGAWYAANQSTLVKGKTYSSADLVYDVSTREQAPIKVGATLASTDAAKLLGLAPRRLSKITLSTETPKNCRVSTKGVTGIKAGSCSLLITVTEPSSGQTSSRYARAFLKIKK